MAGWPTLVVVGVALALFAAVSNAETQGKMTKKYPPLFFFLLFLPFVSCEHLKKPNRFSS
jgi:hypothetical protein